MTRTILHADLDAFYASVEQLDHPELRGQPVVVGGPPESRGVVAAASYEARRFGVRSAMPMSRALRICPDAVRMPPRFGRYGELSQQVMAIFRAVTPFVEPLSLDEAFLDATEHAERYGGAEALGRHLKDEVRATTQLTLSVGAGTNKTVAKIASDAGKPDGLVVVAAGQEAAFLAPLPVRALWGVGPKAETTLRTVGIRTVAEIASTDPSTLERLFGERGLMLHRMARGIDERTVEPEQERKSVGAETTFAQDLPDGPELRAELARIAAEVSRRLRSSAVRSGTIALKLRYARFRTITRQTSLADPIESAEDIERVTGVLLDAVAQPEDRFRLLGIHCAKLQAHGDPQLRLWQPGPAEAKA